MNVTFPAANRFAHYGGSTLTFHPNCHSERSEESLNSEINSGYQTKFSTSWVIPPLICLEFAKPNGFSTQHSSPKALGFARNEPSNSPCHFDQNGGSEANKASNSPCHFDRNGGSEATAVQRRNLAEPETHVADPQNKKSVSTPNIVILSECHANIQNRSSLFLEADFRA